MSDLPSPSGERRPSECDSSSLPPGLGHNFRDQPLNEQMDRLAALLKDHEDRMDLSDGGSQVLTESIRSIKADLADVARQYIKLKFCVKLTGQDIPRSPPGEDTCQVLWELVARKYCLKFSQLDRSQVSTHPSRFLFLQ